jgi:hypothetical protein
MANNTLSPVIVFQVNLETLQRYGWSLPNRTQKLGNETVSEADNQKATRISWFPGLGLGNYYLRDGNQFTVSGRQAVYLKNTYATGTPDALLTVVSYS